MPDTQIIPPARPQRSMSIKGLVPRLPERGRIKIGIKGEMITSQRGNQFQPPQKLDHFRLTTLERGADGNFLLDTAFHAKYGPEPTEIPVRLLYDSPELNFPTRYACYIGRSLWCTGDGETATRLTEAPQDLKTPGAISPREVACTCPRAEATYQGSDRCKVNGSLSVLVEGMGGIGGVWKFRTTSWNSIVGILSSMQFLRSVTSGVLANIPLMLRIQPKQATNPANPTQGVLIYVVSIEYPGEISELQDIAHRIALDRATTHISITHIEAEARRLLELPAPANVVLPGDEPDEVVEEYYPEQVEGAAAAISGDAPPRPTREQFASPQAPEKEKKEPPPTPTLNEAEQVEFDALVEAGGKVAPEGTAAFTKWWNKKGTKLYRKELTDTYLADWAAVAKAADEEIPFEVVDMVGDVKEYPTVEEAVAAYRVALADAEKDKGEAGLTTVWDNNQGFMRHLDERGHDALSKELSLEYGKAREEAAARVPHGTDDIPPNDYSDEAINEENHRRSEEDPAEPPFAPTATAPEPTDASPAPTGRGGAPSPVGRGRTATKAASPSELRRPVAVESPGASGSSALAGTELRQGTPSPERDLLGDQPAEVITIWMARNPKPSDLNNFADQMLEMIAEKPDDALRRTRIKMANETGLLALKAGAVERYDEVMAALARKA